MSTCLTEAEVNRMTAEGKESKYKETIKLIEEKIISAAKRGDNAVEVYDQLSSNAYTNKRVLKEFEDIGLMVPPSDISGKLFIVRGTTKDYYLGEYFDRIKLSIAAEIKYVNIYEYEGKWNALIKKYLDDNHIEYVKIDNNTLRLKYPKDKVIVDEDEPRTANLIDHLREKIKNIF